MRMDIDTVGCPTSEDLAAFVDGRLRQAERARIEMHLADCDMCRETVADTVSLSTQPLPGAAWNSSRRAIAAGAAVLALAASLILVLVQPDVLRFGQENTYPDLVAAVGTNRTVEGRLTGGFEYAPMRTARRAARVGDTEDFELLAATSALRQRAVEAPTAANRHAAGVGELVLGNYDEAVATLEAVVAAEPGKAAYHSDLAAAYLARGREWDRADDFTKARAAADRAVALDPALNEASFNRALALDALGQVAEAEQAYERLLTRDPRYPWNADISSRLEQLKRR